MVVSLSLRDFFPPPRFRPLLLKLFIILFIFKHIHPHTSFVHHTSSYISTDYDNDDMYIYIIPVPISSKKSGNPCAVFLFIFRVYKSSKKGTNGQVLIL